jgi:hypothetical protein
MVHPDVVVVVVVGLVILASDLPVTFVVVATEIAPFDAT